ncbi:fimbrial protein [Pseudomonas alkylphenolica]|uniref:fimbrial protein n=1 Tax=Pseudomonas alkylphenolica TaxID=237609 RepID=UPI00315D81F4
MNYTKAAILITILGSSDNATAAACAFNPIGTKADTLTIPINPTLSIPRDTPNNTTLYESPTQILSTEKKYSCSSSGWWGAKATTGTTPPTANLYPIGDTGLAWQWIYQGKPISAHQSGISAGKIYSHTNTAHSFRLVKIGEIKSNTKIPAGIIGYVEGGELRVLEMRIWYDINIVAQSCETPDVKVDMGNHDLGDFSQSGSYSKPTSFNIRLNNCPSGINKVMYSLAPTPTTPAWNARLGIIELNRNSTAKGFALQILDSNENPLELNKNHVFNDYSSTGGNFTIPLSARYYRTFPTKKDSKDVKPGTANTEVTFVMSYL